MFEMVLIFVKWMFCIIRGGMIMFFFLKWRGGFYIDRNEGELWNY